MNSKIIAKLFNCIKFHFVIVFKSLFFSAPLSFGENNLLSVTRITVLFDAVIKKEIARQKVVLTRLFRSVPSKSIMRTCKLITGYC